jgi:transcriptional regulator GlxA family with amidase domain
LIPTIRLEAGCRYLVLRQPVAYLPFPESLVCGALIAADHSRPGAVTAESRAALPHVLRTAIEIMEAQAHAPLTVAVVAARSHVSVRALQKAFRRHLHISPMAYLRDVRLRRAHEALVEADPSVDTVTSICHRWSFTHPGRFAALHKARYGESPSATLHRTNM